MVDIATQAILIGMACILITCLFLLVKAGIDIFKIRMAFFYFIDVIVSDHDKDNFMVIQTIFTQQHRKIYTVKAKDKDTAIEKVLQIVLKENVKKENFNLIAYQIKLSEIPEGITTLV